VGETKFVGALGIGAGTIDFDQGGTGEGAAVGAGTGFFEEFGGGGRRIEQEAAERAENRKGQKP